MQNIKKYFMTLALLIAAVTGAWAEEKMVTINSSTTSSGAVTATGFNISNNYLYVSKNPATITTSEGVITKLVIKKYDGTYGHNLTEANVGVTPGTITYGSDEIIVKDINAESVTLSRKGGSNWSTSSVDVYYVEPTEWPLTPDADKKVWTLTKMPASDVELQVAYFPGMLTLAPTAADKKGGTLELVVTPMTEITTDNVPAGWSGKFSASADDLPADFVAMTQDEAVALGAPTSGFSLVIFAVENEEFKVLTWENGVMQGVKKRNCYNMYSLINNDNIQSFYTVASSTGATGLPAGFEQDDKGNIYVEKDTKFKVKAVPAEGYHLVGWSDDATIKELEREFTMTDDDFTLTATFSDAYDIAFQAANALTIQSGKATVKVGDAEKTLDQDGKLSVKAGQTVTLTAKQGYKFRKVEAKKAGAEKPVTLATALEDGATLEVMCKSSESGNGLQMGGNFTNNNGEFTRNNFVGESNVFSVMKATATISGTTITFATGFTSNDNYDHNVTLNTTDNTYTLTGGSNKGSVVSVKVNGTEVLDKLTELK